VVIAWTVARLGWAERLGRMNDGRLFGLLQNDDSRLTTLYLHMDAADLPAERWVHPIHNTIEAWKIARYLRASQPTYVWMACADVQPDDLPERPALEPGQQSYGPLWYGFRLHEGPPREDESDPWARLLLSLDAETLCQDEQLLATVVTRLSAWLERTDLDAWAVVPLLSRVGQLLPPGLQRAMGERLPKGSASAAQMLEEARARLGASNAAVATSTEAAEPRRPSGVVLGAKARDEVAELLRQESPDCEKATRVIESVVPELSNLDDKDLLGVVSQVASIWDRANSPALTRRLLKVLEALPARASDSPLSSNLKRLKHAMNLSLGR